MNLAVQLDQLESAQLVRRAEDSEPAFQFKHTLTQETVYQSLLRAKRREIHVHVARAYEAAYPDRLDEYAALLAQHYGEAGDDAKTLEYATRAGDAAARVYANAEAVQFYSQAIDTAKRVGAIHESPLRDLCLKRGRVLELLGRIQDALANYRAMESLAQERGDRALELAALIALATLHSTPTIAHDAEETKRLSDGALAIAREIGDRAAEAKILWNLQNLAFFTNDARTGIRYGEQALAVARQFNLREQTAYILNDLSRIYLMTGETVEAMRAVRDAQKVWDELGNVPMLADNLATAGETSAYAGALSDASEYCQQAIQLAQSISNPWVQAYARWTEGLVTFERGDVGRALAAMDESRRMAKQAGFAAAQLGGQSDLGLMYGLLGAFERGIELCQRTIQLDSVGFLPFLPWALAHLSRVYARQGNLTAAAEVAREAREKHPSRDYIVYLTVPIALAEGELALAQKDYPEAVAAVAPVVARYHATGIAYRAADAFLVQARAWLAQGELDRAEEALKAARALAERMPSRQALWQILLEQSRVAGARGEAAQAKMLRDQARDVVNYIADHIGESKLQASFLALPDVCAVMESR
jgi:tetratricopeptide (TPR) repeat protein